MKDRENKSKKGGFAYGLSTEKGFSLVELLIALTIFAFGMLAVATMQTAAMRGNMLTRSLTEALRNYNQNKAEQLLSLRYSNANLSDDADGPTTHGPEVAYAANGVAYTTSWSVEKDALYTGAKSVTVTTSWKDQFGNHNVSTAFIKDSVL